MSRRYLLIAATNAVAAQVRVAADRLSEVDPDVARTIVVLDDDPASHALLDGAGEVLGPVDVGLDDDTVGMWIGAYGEEGLLWAAFPHVLRSVGTPGEHVLWLGADLEIEAAPESLWSALGASPLVAGLAAPPLAPHGHELPDAKNGRPHSLQPVTAVAEHEGELVARSLLGWVASAPETDAALAEWPVPRDLPTHEAVADRAVAQLWFNALALSPDAAVVGAPGLVLSVAQLLSREVATSGDGRVEVDGEALELIALRNFDAELPHLLEGEVVTARVSDRPALAAVLERRAAALLAAGWTAADAGVSRWSTLPEGLPWTALTGALIRAGIRAGAITRSPYSDAGFEEFHAYATAPARSGGSLGINRLLHAVHASRVDLHAAYPALDGPDGLGFLGWAWVYGRHEMGIPERFLPPRPNFLDATTTGTSLRQTPDTPGVNLAGYFTSELGLGESVRQIAAALEAAGVEVTPVQGLLVPPTRQQAGGFSPVGPQDADHDVNVVVINGDQMPEFVRDVGEPFFAGRHTIGVWWWEVDPFPIEEWREALQWLDEIWVGTDFIKSLVEPHVDVPVWVFPVPVSVEPAEDPVPRSHFGWADDETVFLYIWDYHSTEARKNPSGLVEAYRKAFPEGSRTRLVLKCINHENLPEHDEKVRLAAAGRSDIEFIDRFLSKEEKDSLLELCDCYVSPHRSEGFGYTPAEAMLLGKPVVVTAYGGTTQYTDDSVARMVKWAPAEVGPRALPYPPDGRWADPDIDDLAAALRWVVDQPEQAAAMAERGRERVSTQHDPARTGAVMAGRLEEVRARGAAGSDGPQGSDQRAADGRRPFLRRLLSGRAGAPLRPVRRRWWSLMDRAVVTRTRTMRDELAALQHRVESLDAQARRGLEAARRERRELAERLGEEPGRQIADMAAHLREQLSERDDALARRADQLDRTLAEHLERHSVQPYGITEAGMEIEEVPGIGRALGASNLASTGDRYADFLAVFRGPYERVRELMEPYGPLLIGHGPLLDVGCGRGELLDVATQAGIEAVGVDLDAELVEQAQSRGHVAEVGDGIARLADAADGSLGAVSAIHVIEHLEVPQLEKLFAEALRALRPGGMMLIETINPHEVSAASTFWVDPTHHGPIFPEVALALALSSGFSSAHVFAPDGTADWSRDRTRSTRYALVARSG